MYYKTLKDDAALGTDGLAFVAGFSAGLLARLAVLASGSGVLDLGCTTQVTEATKSLAVGRRVEGQVSLADSHTLREALRTTRDDGNSWGGVELWSGRDGGGKGQESDDKLHHGVVNILTTKINVTVASFNVDVLSSQGQHCNIKCTASKIKD